VKSCIVADDNAAARSALVLALERRLHVQSISEAASMSALLQHVQAESPALVLLDWDLPGLAAAGGVKTLRALCPDVIVVALSARPEAREAAVAAGVDAFLSKVDAPEMSLQTVRALLAGRTGSPPG